MRTICISLALGLALCALNASAFNSGSTGADGALTPNVSTTINLPASGVLQYTEINIPAGVTVRFSRNALNTPVTLLVAGNATIAGIIDLDGDGAADSNGAGSGNVADDGLPGAAGPGGYGGGRGGLADPSTAALSPRVGQAGIGPGGGRPTTGNLATVNYNSFCYGSGGSFGSVGVATTNAQCGPPPAAPVYGHVALLPLIGGSGGSGGNGQTSTGGSGGGGGGGALLLAVSGTLHVTGSIRANGGRGGDIGHVVTMSGGGTVGGGGSGGGLRLVATTLSGNGPISASGGRSGYYGTSTTTRGDGGAGRIRLEAETMLRTTATDPPYSFGAPGELFIAGLPTLRISSLAGIAAPAAPTGQGDIVLPSTTPNVVTVVVETTQVPLGNTVEIIYTPARGLPSPPIQTSALAGSLALATAQASVSIGDGASTLLATVTYAVSGPEALAYSRYTGGEPVVAVQVQAGLDGATQTVLITASDRRVTL